MCLLIQIIYFSSILLNAGTKVLNSESEQAQCTLSNFNIFNFENMSFSFCSKQLYGKNKRYSFNSILTGMMISGTTNFISKDTPNKIVLGAISNMIKSTLKNHIDTESSRTYQTDIDFDLRKREDAFQLTNPKDNPYAVGLLCKFGEHMHTCSGSLLTDEWVLTARHCVEFGGKIGDAKIYVYAGGKSLLDAYQHLEQGALLPVTSQLSVSSGIFRDDQGLDIALTKLSEKFNLTNYVNTIKLSNIPWQFRGYRNCVTTTFGQVMGFEMNDDDFIRKTHVLEVKQPCLCSYWYTFMDYRTNDLLCAKPVQDYGVCEGDSGGGLVCDGRLVAVNMMISGFKDVRYCDIDFMGSFLGSIFGTNIITCGSKNTLSVFQAVCPSLPWINGHVKLFSDAELVECKDLKSGETLAIAQLWLVAFVAIIHYNSF